MLNLARVLQLSTFLHILLSYVRKTLCEKKEANAHPSEVISYSNIIYMTQCKFANVELMYQVIHVQDS